MMNLEFYKSLSLNQSFLKKVTVKQYSGKVTAVNQAASGGSYVVIYQLEILPNGSNFVDIFYVEDHETQQCIPHICEGVEEFIKLVEKHEQSLQGFDLLVSDAVFHEIDFKGNKYRDITTDRLQNIIQFTSTMRP